MENRRLLTFLLSSMVILWIWSAYFSPPPKPKKPAPPAAAAEKAKAADVAKAAGNGDSTPANIQVAQNEASSITLGSLDPESGYALEVVLTSVGGSVEKVSLTSPQFRDLKDQTKAAQIVGNNDTADRTFSIAAAGIDAILEQHGQSLQSAHWKLAESKTTEEAATAVYEYDAPDGSLRLRKTYSVPKSKLTGDELATAWKDNPKLYTVNVTLDVINLTDAPTVFEYELQGPVGLLLENREHTFKYRDIHVEFAGGNKAATLNVASLQGYCNTIEADMGRKASLDELRAELREDHEWTTAPRYAGIDVQFFSAMIAPVPEAPAAEGEEAAATWIDRTYPMLIGPDLRETSDAFFVTRVLRGIWTAFFGRPVDPRTADISFRFASAPLKVGAKETVSHSYEFFVGPKRRELLDPPPFSAGQVLNYGWFGPVARVMHFLLDFFYGLGMPYVLAIVSLTVLVRGCLFPLSRKQAIMAARQKELQPQLKALKEKYADDQQKFARAQMELWRKNNINPLSGCLPLLLQFPIFVGLYTALNSAIDLRLQKFLWIDNLASPDALFRLPFALPLGLGHDFSILPLCTVGLFLIQQKMFMPPAQDEQQELQYKMMNFMTAIMGIFFWHQPSGLCVYFIASSVWSIAERKLLGTGKVTPTTATVQVIEPDAEPAQPAARKTQEAPAEKPKVMGFWDRLLEKAAEAQKEAERQREKDRKGKKK